MSLRSALAILTVGSAFLFGICPLARADRAPADQYLNYALDSCGRTKAQMPQITQVAETVANRHIQGGTIGFLYNGQGLDNELSGRSGGMMNLGPQPSWTTAPRTDAQKANDVVIAGWQRAPRVEDLAALREFRKAGDYIIGFGPRTMPELAAYVPLCDVWFDTGLGADDRVAHYHGGSAGHANLLVEMLDAWTLTAEIVGALTRQGKMPVMWKSFSYADGRDWMGLYMGKMQFHTDYTIAPYPPGVLGGQFIDAIRGNLHWFKDNQLDRLNQSAALVVAESKAGRKSVVAGMGHSVFSYIGQYEDGAWCQGIGMEDGTGAEGANFQKATPDGALVLRLGYTGLHHDAMDAFRAKKQRVILIAVPNPRPEWQLPADVELYIDMGWKFGDAAVTVPGYPIRILPPSGIMEMAAYQSIAADVAAGLPEVEPVSVVVGP